MPFVVEETLNETDESVTKQYVYMIVLEENITPKRENLEGNFYCNSFTNFFC